MRKKAAFPIPTQLEKQPKPNISKTKRWDEELVEHPSSQGNKKWITFSRFF
jgi:hypothetical protein